MSTMSILSPSSPLISFPRKPQIVIPTAIFRAVNSSSLTSTPQKAPKTSTTFKRLKTPIPTTSTPPPQPSLPPQTPPQPTVISTDETAIATAAAGDSIASKKKALVPIGFGTEEMEAVIIVDVLRRAGADVVVASVEAKLEVEASTGTRLVADRSITSCSDEVFDLVALPGGMPGSARLRDCEVLRKITTKQADEKRFYGAICAAPAVTLNSWGLLRRKQTTCHPAFMAKLPHFWAVSSNLQVSGELTTSRGPGTTFQFALSLVEQLLGEAVAKEVGQSLLMHIAADTPRKEEFNKVEWSIDHIPRVLIPVPNGSEEIEVVTMIDILRRAKVDVTVASLEKSMQIVAAQGTKIIADKSIGNAAESIYDLIILPGGLFGAERLQKSRILKKLLKEQESAGRMYGSISSSSTTLQKHGLLKNKRIASHPSILSTLPSEPVDISARVVIDGKLITSTGLSTVTDFALAIVDKFFGHPRARSVAEGLVFEYPRTER